VQDLARAFTTDPAAAEATSAIRALIDRVTAMPNPKGRSCTITITGRITALLDLGTQSPAKPAKQAARSQL
jgi:hypothetical protein